MSSRSLLAPGVALIAAGAVALGPAIVAPSALTAAQPTIQIPAVQIRDIQLAGVGRAIYDLVVQNAVDPIEGAIENVVQIIPIVGDLIANQIGIGYQLVMDLVEPTVYFPSTVWQALFSAPLTIPYWAGNYAFSLAYAPVNALASELGLNIPSDLQPANWPDNTFPLYNLITGQPTPPPYPTAAVRAPRAAAKSVTSRSAGATRGTAKAAGAKTASAKAAGARKAAKPARAAAAK